MLPSSGWFHLIEQAKGSSGHLRQGKNASIQGVSLTDFAGARVLQSAHLIQLSLMRKELRRNSGD